MKEFPKMLYRNAETCIVSDADKQAGAEKDGWHEFGKDAPKKKRGRPAKKASDE